MSLDFVSLEKPKITYKERKFSKILLFFENIFKVPLLGCQQCGECLLSSTSFTCSQRCPKRLRNGPCGGTGENGTCEVFPDRKCVWYVIYKRSKKLKRTKALYQIKKIHNWNLEHTSAWLNVFKKRIDPPVIFLSKIKNPLSDTDHNDITRKA